MIQKSIELLKKYTKHQFIELTSRGNTSIFAALYCARKLNLDKKTVLVPDQGGWFSYLKYPKMLEMKPVEVKTDYGIINLEDLKNKAKNANCLIYSNPAGYFAEQPIEDIYKICKKNDCLVIMDVTGSIGSGLCDGKFADFCVGSFGKWKPINIGYGGFLSAKKKEYFDKPKEIFNTTSFDENYATLLYEKLKNVKKRYEFFNRINKKIKKDLKNFNILHENKRGVNVIVRFSNEKEKNKIIDYCTKNKYQFTICPRYIRINEKAVSIEIKREE